MGEVCSAREVMKIVYTILSGKPEGKRPFRVLRRS
jgi:hypothetical protein